MNNDSEIDWEIYDTIWDPLERSITARKSSLRKTLQQIRETQSIEKRLVVAELERVNVLASKITKQPELREVDREEFNRDLRSLKFTLQYLRNIAEAFKPPTQDQITQILANGTRPESLADRVEIYDSTARLILLARPSGKQFWDLARTTLAAIDSDLSEAKGYTRTKLLQIKESVHCVAPSWVFKDKSHYGSHSRYAHRTTEIKSIAAGGLPGLGKRG